MTELWTKDCPGIVEAECVNGEICVTCYETIAESPRVQEGLLHLWRFEEGEGARVSDWKGDAHLDIENSDSVAWIDNGGLRILDPTLLTAGLDPLTVDGGLTLEAWVKPDLEQYGRVFSWSENRANVNLELRQNGTDWTIRCRGESNGAPSLSTEGGLAVPQLTHIVWALDVTTQRETLYLNNWLALGGDRILTDFGEFPLVVSNIPEGSRAWLGELHLLALYDRTFSKADVEQNFIAGPHPESGVPVPDYQSLVDALRTESWKRTGIPRNDDAALLKHARNGKLGAPLTREFGFLFGGVEYIAQGFANAIAYVQFEDWGNVQELRW